MAENNICGICGGYIRSVLIAHDKNGIPLASAQPIRLCPGHTTTDAGLVRLVGGSGTVTYTLPATGEQGYKSVAIVGEPGPEPYALPAGSSVFPNGYFQRDETLWEIAEEVGKGEMIAGDVMGGRYCIYCYEDPDDDHTPNCIVTKSRALMEWRKAQPRIEVNIKKDGE